MADTRLDRRWHIADVHLDGSQSALSNSRDDLLKERSETKVSEGESGGEFQEGHGKLIPTLRL